jgi:hypothetical protein
MESHAAGDRRGAGVALCRGGMTDGIRPAIRVRGAGPAAAARLAGGGGDCAELISSAVGARRASLPRTPRRGARLAGDRWIVDAKRSVGEIADGARDAIEEIVVLVAADLSQSRPCPTGCGNDAVGGWNRNALRGAILVAASAGRIRVHTRRSLAFGCVRVAHADEGVLNGRTHRDVYLGLQAVQSGATGAGRIAALSGSSRRQTLARPEDVSGAGWPATGPDRTLVVRRAGVEQFQVRRADAVRTISRLAALARARAGGSGCEWRQAYMVQATRGALRARIRGAAIVLRTNANLRRDLTNAVL